MKIDVQLLRDTYCCESQIEKFRECFGDVADDEGVEVNEDTLKQAFDFGLGVGYFFRYMLGKQYYSNYSDILIAAEAKSFDTCGKAQEEELLRNLWAAADRELVALTMKALEGKDPEELRAKSHRHGMGVRIQPR